MIPSMLARTEILKQVGTRTLLMGVLNVTPDSFSDGGRFTNVEATLAHARQLAGEGADILDIGGESTRPGASPVSLEEELKRAIPVIRAVRAELPQMCISVDTYKARVAEEALEAGADMLNDVSALRFDSRMARVIAQADAPVVLMHMLGTPQTMQQSPTYKDVVAEIIKFLSERIVWATQQGISEERIVIDPGIGFGKKPEHNTQILRRLSEFKVLGRPLLLGTSRKSFLGALTKRPVEKRVEETIASVVIGVLHGADLVRVHDVGPIKHALMVADAIRY
ncbi:MAG: dihydropteroate synthase [Candidatus Fraserbacteria bacterium RBG_16_55_9]|uniref:Dihydropteroate synthase n=1 Tax=Fraserbacteria sp. (strain RBG_16_55_9) TaxID=1817864 RepID=A0A1F5UWG3_FRAXR|nr:MAG: dihydropteroate synthase [Candidatus Fraserbacteria bacterium RBG_16_55_9]